MNGIKTNRSRLTRSGLGRLVWGSADLRGRWPLSGAGDTYAATSATFPLNENVDREHKHTRAEQAEAREEEGSTEVVRLVHQPAFRQRRDG